MGAGAGRGQETGGRAPKQLLGRGTSFKGGALSACGARGEEDALASFPTGRRPSGIDYMNLLDQDHGTTTTSLGSSFYHSRQTVVSLTSGSSSDS